MDSLLLVSPSIVLSFRHNNHLYHRRLAEISITCTASVNQLRISDKFHWGYRHASVFCKLSGEGEHGAVNDQRDKQKLERAMRMDCTIPGTPDAFVGQVSSCTYDMRNQLQQTFDSSNYDVVDVNPWQETSKSVYVLTHQGNQLCIMKTYRNHSEVEKELGLLSKGGKLRNQSNQSRPSTKFQMLVEDVQEGLLEFEDQNEAVKYCDLLQGEGQDCEGVAEIDASSAFYLSKRRFVPSFFSMVCPTCRHDQNLLNTFGNHFCVNPVYRNCPISKCQKSLRNKLMVLRCISDAENGGKTEKTGNSKYKWVKTGPNLTKEHQLAISKIPAKMSNRCKVLMKQIICFSTESGSVSDMLAAWVKSTRPQRADWLAVLKELDSLNHPLYFEMAEHAFIEESFEANVRDYTKIIHQYAKQNKLQEAENVLATMKNRGFLYDQVTLTALIHMYSKSGNLKLAEDSFEEMRLLGIPLDRRSYGSMIMAYIRAGMLTRAESLLREMEAREIYAGREVYKALLRGYSMLGDSEGAQRVFEAIQFAGIIPDAKVCALLINAYIASGQSKEAHMAFENMRLAGLEPNDKCIALVLTAYEKENKLKEALDVLAKLERDGVTLGEEASELLVKWFQRLGIMEEV